jgi:hypothetical protein
MNAVLGKASTVHPVFPSTVYHLDIPRMRIVTIQFQDNEIFIGGFTKRTKCLNLGVKMSFWIHSAAIDTGGGLSRSSAFTLLLGNTRRGGTYVTVKSCR